MTEKYINIPIEKYAEVTDDVAFNQSALGRSALQTCGCLDGAVRQELEGQEKLFTEARSLIIGEGN